MRSTCPAMQRDRRELPAWAVPIVFLLLGVDLEPLLRALIS